MVVDKVGESGAVSSLCNKIQNPCHTPSNADALKMAEMGMEITAYALLGKSSILIAKRSNYLLIGVLI